MCITEDEMRASLKKVFGFGMLVTMTGLACGATAAVTLTDKAGSVVLNNGLISLDVEKRTGNPLSLIYGDKSLLASPGYINWHAESDDEEAETKGGKPDNTATYTRIKSGEFKI